MTERKSRRKKTVSERKSNTKEESQAGKVTERHGLAGWVYDSCFHHRVGLEQSSLSRFTCPYFFKTVLHGTKAFASGVKSWRYKRLVV